MSEELPDSPHHGDYGHICWEGCEVWMTDDRAKAEAKARQFLQPRFPDADEKDGRDLTDLIRTVQEEGEQALRAYQASKRRIDDQMDTQYIARAEVKRVVKKVCDFGTMGDTAIGKAILELLGLENPKDSPPVTECYCATFDGKTCHICLEEQAAALGLEE